MSSEKITESEDVVDESVIGEAVDEAPLRLIVHTEDGAQSTTIEPSAKVCDLPAGNKFEPAWDAEFARSSCARDDRLLFLKIDQHDIGVLAQPIEDDALAVGGEVEG